MNQLEHKNKFLAFMGVLLVGSMVVFGALAVGSAAGATTELHNSSYQIDSQTKTVWLEATDTNNSDVTVEFVGVYSDGSTNSLKTATINNGAGQTNRSSYSVTQSDVDSYEKIRVTLDGSEVGSVSSGTTLEDVELHNVTHTLSDDSESVWVDVTDTNGTAATVEVIGVTSDGTEYQLSSKVVNPDNTTATVYYDLSDADLSDYQDVRVLVDGKHADSIDSGLTARISGGSASGSSLSFVSGQTMGVSNSVIIVIFLVFLTLAWVGGKE